MAVAAVQALLGSEPLAPRTLVLPHELMLRASSAPPP